MSIKTTLLCDECKREIEDYHTTKSLAAVAECVRCNVKGIAFQTWNDKDAMKPGMLHFHNDSCAQRYLSLWLIEHREAVLPIPAALPVQKLDSGSQPEAAVESVAVPSEVGSRTAAGEGDESRDIPF